MRNAAQQLNCEKIVVLFPEFVQRRKERAQIGAAKGDLNHGQKARKLFF
jgi:hypothetical protein